MCWRAEMAPMDRLRVPVLAAAAIVTLAAIYMAVLYAPTDKATGDVQRIMYFHVASAWVSYVGFSVTFVAGIQYLRTRALRWDNIALSSAEIGVMFCTLAITTGPMWAKAVWGVFWRWEDLKLLMTLVLWLVFIAYLALRSNVQDRHLGARLGAVFGSVGMLCVPLSLAANRIWSQFHPTVIATSKGSLQPSMGAALGVAVIAFTLLYAFLLLARVGVERARDDLETLKQRIGEKHE
jgi:heme exporter protein C